MWNRHQDSRPWVSIVVFCTMLVFAASCQAPNDHAIHQMSGAVDDGIDLYIIPEDGVLETEQYWLSDEAVSQDPIPIPEISRDELFELLGEDFTFLSVPPIDSDVGQHRRVNRRTAPWRFGGRLESSKGTCTAQLVEHRNVLLTAAHCVQDPMTGAYYNKVVLKRGFLNGRFDELLSAKCIRVPRNWVTGTDKGDSRYDWAVITTNRPSTSDHYLIQGGLQWQAYTTWGYSIRFGGTQRAHAVDGKLGKVSDGVAQLLHSRLNKGASGGAWIEETGNRNYAAGVNSFVIKGEPEQGMFSPVFDGTIVRTVRGASGC